MGMSFNPMNVMMGQGKPGQPYIGMPRLSPGTPSGSVGPVYGDGGKQKSIQTGTNAPPPAAAPNVVGAESVRASGSGPFDNAYRQDLATFAGGLFGRPGGSLSFNPTSNQPFGSAPSGGGNAPVIGMPNTLLQNALGGNPFSFTPPQPQQKENAAPAQVTIPDWMKQFTLNGGSPGNLLGAQQ